MMVEHRRLKIFFTSVIYILGLLYAIVSLGYALLEIFSSTTNNLIFSNLTKYYYAPLINHITFLMHSVSGIFIFTVGPLVFISFQKDWASKIFFLRLYLILALLPLLWPLVFLFEAQGVSTSTYIISTIEFLSFFTLVKAYLYYRKNNLPVSITFVIYNYCILLGALLWGVILFILHLIVNDPSFASSILTNSTDIKLEPANLWYDVSWYIVLILGILLVKIIMRTKSIPLAAEDEQDY